jgi:hypothetical protein
MSWPNKDPDDILDYGRDFADEFPDSTIVSAQILTTEGLTPGPAVTSDKLVTTRLSGGVAGKSYSVTFRLTFADGQQVDRSERLFVTHR